MTNSLAPTQAGLKAISERDWKVSPYSNRRGVFGVSLQFSFDGQCHMISISNLLGEFKPWELSEALEGIDWIDDARRGFYSNRFGAPGFYVTARSSKQLNGTTDHWYMISRSHEREPIGSRDEEAHVPEQESELEVYLSRLKEDPRFW